MKYYYGVMHPNLKQIEIMQKKFAHTNFRSKELKILKMIDIYN